MQIDRTHKGWLLASLAILGVSLLLYAVYRVPFAGRSMGGTVTGLAFGSVGFAFMIFAALLGARKRVPVCRFGRAQTWMRGHLWLGLLSLPLILFHSGFRYGHGLTAWLMTLLIIVVVSGVFGAALQHYMPRVMTREVTMETIYEEIGHVRAQLREEAEELIEQATGGNKKEGDKEEAAVSGQQASAETAVAVADETASLRDFYAREMKPFLETPGARGRPWATRRKRAAHSPNCERWCQLASHDDRGSGRNLRRGTPTHPAEPVAHVAARLAAAAHPPFAGVALARRGACRDGAAILTGTTPIAGRSVRVQRAARSQL